MPRILAIDCGTKRVGFAVTDPLQLIASPLDAMNLSEAHAFISNYVKKEEVEGFVLGLPKGLNGVVTDGTLSAKKMGAWLKEQFPDKKIYWIDERFTSVMAEQSMRDGGLKKKDRQNKHTIDKVSAAIILQSFLSQRK
jgi:putative Holliday junction resolvase